MSAECGRRGRGGFCCARRTMRRREKFACNARERRVSFRCIGRTHRRRVYSDAACRSSPSSTATVASASLRSLMGARHRARLCTDSTSSLSARATRYGQEQGRMLGDSCAASAQNAQRSSLRSERLVQIRACHARDSGVSCARPLDVREA
jgi:hypothetical protein